MKLTILNRLKICFEVLTIKSGHEHTAQEKQLSIFQHGYEAGLRDFEIEDNDCYGCEHYYGLKPECLAPSLTPCPRLD